ncbi:PXA domain-containing protein [Lentinula edodes]|uniref:PXA domain-containing protein n=1 Tax=Lentinula lateritia TaxID=40482 RepID=A0A9W9DKJ9_9AGAR|nr:PXA domain-containing protein [Lentinula edodes]
MSNRRHVAPSVASNSNSSHVANRSVPLFKRLLFPTAPASFDLPPLLLNSSVSPEFNAELYDFIALALRAFVQPWWTKITRYDKEFLPIITNILTHVFRTLEDRLAKAHQRGDLAELVFRDIPVIITQHYRDFRFARSKLNSSYAAGGALSIPALFHASQSHMAVKPGGEIDLDYVRFLVDHILKTCLPREDWDPETERVIVREIIVKLVAQDILGKITQPWFIEKMILDQLMNIPSTKPKVTTPHSNGFSTHTLLVFVLTLIQSISGVCLALVHAYRQLIVTMKEVNQHSGITETSLTTPPPEPPIPASHSPSVTVAIDPLLVTQTQTDHSALPLEPSISSSSVDPSSSGVPSSSSSEANYDTITDLPHDYATYIVVMLAEIFTTNSRYAGNTIMSTIGMATSQGVAGKWLDKFLPYLLTRTLSTNLMQTMTRTAKRTLFPNGYPAPPPIDPTLEEQAETRRKLVEFLDDNALAPLLLGPSPSDTISMALQPLETRECNVHLFMLLLDRILGVLMPELFDGT